MKSKIIKIVILFFLVIILSTILVLRQNAIKKYFKEERYYSIFVFLKLAHPHYKPYKNFFEIFSQEGLNYDLSNKETVDQGLKFIEQINELPELNSIPKISHHAYFTGPNQEKNFGGFLAENLKHFIANMKKYGDWKHYVWTNNPKLFSEIEDVVIVDIAQFKEHALYKNLQEILKKGEVSRAYLAAASDIVRLLALEQYGGIYKDLDYEIYNYDLFYKYFSRFDFIGGRERYSIKSYYGNSFIVAKKNHPIISRALQYIYRNLNESEGLPKYIKFPSVELDAIYFSGPPVITFSYFKENKNPNYRNIILPAWMIYNMHFAHSLNKRCDLNNMPVEDFNRIKDSQQNSISSYLNSFETIKFNDDKDAIKYHNIYYNSNYRRQYPIIGADMFCGSWATNHGFKHIFYWKIP